MKILVVEDDLLVADALKTTLSDRKYTVEIAHDGQAALDFIEAFDYDLLLLDSMLPKLDGVSLCRHVRSQGYMMPILLLTSLNSNHDRATGLDAGADDYVVKPFDPEELSARIRALLRRGNDRVSPILKWEDLTLDPRSYEVNYQQQLLSLTPKEYALLELFLRYSRRLFSCGAILEHLWTYEDAPTEEAVRTHIKGLRHKLKAAGAPTDFVETVYGIGYRLKSPDNLSEKCDLGVSQLGGGPDQTSKAPFQDGEKCDLGVSLGSLQISLAQPPLCGIDPQLDLPPPVIDVAPIISKTESIADPLQFLKAIWDRHYPQMLDRVASIDRVITATEDRSLTTEIRHQARHCAHNLAGSLGTFGLPLGSKVAKQLELLLAGTTDLTPNHLLQLQVGVDRLRQEMANKMPTAQLPIPTLPQNRFRKAEAAPTKWLLIITHDPSVCESLQSAGSDFEIVSASELIPTQLEQQPQAIVCDLDCFPQVDDGLTALSDLDRDYPHIPVLVLGQPAEDIAATGTRSLPQRIEIARRGGRVFLAKPLAPSQIFGAVDRVLAQSRVRQARVMIVDDDPILLAGVSALLSRQGMTVTTLAEPSRFWETLEVATPDLLILDLDMPTYNGIELCLAVRTDPQWANLPILFLTADTTAPSIDRVFAAGADDFVTKPVVDDTLVTRVLNRLKRIGMGG
jgi:DNA-binding response OmpR family regulator/HPt (histidine-containing phosphotransfer) domain-containing protein